MFLTCIAFVAAGPLLVHVLKLIDHCGSRSIGYFWKLNGWTHLCWCTHAHFIYALNNKLAINYNELVADHSIPQTLCHTKRNTASLPFNSWHQVLLGSVSECDDAFLDLPEEEFWKFVWLTWWLSVPSCTVHHWMQAGNGFIKDINHSLSAVSVNSK